MKFEPLNQSADNCRNPIIQTAHWQLTTQEPFTDASQICRSERKLIGTTLLLCDVNRDELEKLFLQNECVAGVRFVVISEQIDGDANRFDIFPTLGQYVDTSLLCVVIGSK